MKLYRLRIVPESPWRTPWQSDTLAGLLCWACARADGDAILRREVIDPALDGQPPFVLSDAFPGDWLPVPMHVRLWDWPAVERKTVKRARWLSAATFQRVQRGTMPALADLIAETGVHEYTQLRNTIGRATNATSDGGNLFPTDETVLGKDSTGRPLEYLTIYARLRDDFVSRFRQLVEELAGWGFGADRSVGKGQFRLLSGPEPYSEFDAVEGANGCVVLSTYQPAADDPTDGAWEAFTKYGKLGPDFGLDNVFKRPLILLRPGASFRSSAPRGWLGRAIGMRELLAKDAADELDGRGVCLVHWAFGLCLPLARIDVLEGVP